MATNGKGTWRTIVPSSDHGKVTRRASVDTAKAQKAIAVVAGFAKSAEMTTRTAIYAGSFDPLTNGHLDVLKASLSIADTIYAAIGVQASKTPVFTFDDRVRMINEATKAELGDDAARIQVVSFEGLLIEAARKLGASIMIRGLRDGTDLDYEMQMAGMNETMAPDLQTVFLPASPSVRTITATLVRQIAAMGGDVRAFVPENVAQALGERFRR